MLILDSSEIVPEAHEHTKLCRNTLIEQSFQSDKHEGR